MTETNKTQSQIATDIEACFAKIMAQGPNPSWKPESHVIDKFAHEYGLNPDFIRKVGGWVNTELAHIWS